MRILTGTVAVAVALVAAGGLLAAPSTAATTEPPGATTAAGVRETPVSFTVRNVNRSLVACAADGRTYTVRGHLVEPAGGRRSGAVTLYLHGLGLGGFFWHDTRVPGYDYAARLARAGHASVVVDRLGYDSSGKPPGKRTCAGSQADVAHQIVQDLRGGRYAAGHDAAPRFSRVVLAGHSYGGLLSQIEAYSFGDVDGVIVAAYADSGSTALSKKLGAGWTERCAGSGTPPSAPGGGPRGYADFALRPQIRGAFYHDVDPAVFRRTSAQFNADPCGLGSSQLTAVAADKKHVRDIRVPALVVSGGSDALFAPGSGPAQARMFTGSPSVSQVTLAHTAHALTFERTHASFERTVGTWLTAHGDV